LNKKEIYNFENIQKNKMKKFCTYGVLYLLVISACISPSCNEKKPVVEETKTLVFVVNLINDEQKVNEYLAHHQKVWPEVEAGFRKAGYKKIELYRFNRSLVMIVTIPKNANIDSIGKIAENYDPKCREWNQMMDQYQVGVEGTAVGQKWVQAKRIYSFKNE
jgi:L-rhamnose mutarotase